MSGERGILPLVEVNLPEQPRRDDVPWLATEVATPFPTALEDAPLDTIVRAVADIAEILAGLHERDIYHRDVKPENLFRLEHESVVGDFGLVSDSDKEPITETGRKLGPLWFLAPEMLTDAVAALGGPADVYSLAKSLWVLATGQRYPTPGQHRVDSPQTRIGDYVDNPRTYLLDRLVEQATSQIPENRPSMKAMARELRAWSGDFEDTPEPTIDDVAARIQHLTAESMIEDTRRREAEEGGLRVYNRLLEVLRPFEARLRSSGLPARLVSDPTFIGDAFLVRGTTTDGPELLKADGASVVARMPAGATFWAGFGYKAFANGEIDVAAGYLMGPYDFPQGQVGLEVLNVPAGSAQEEALPNVIRRGLLDHLGEALERFAEILERSRGT